MAPLPGRKLFLAPLQIVHDPTTVEQIEFAYRMSKDGHRTQNREDGTPYSQHPKTAAWIYVAECDGRDPGLIINLLLHDILEDTFTLTPYRLGINFGIDRALDIVALTKQPKGKETTEEYLARVVARGPRAILAKLFDRLHNVRTLPSTKPEKIRKQVEETTQYHIPILFGALEGCDPSWNEVITALREKLDQALAQY